MHRWLRRAQCLSRRLPIRLSLHAGSALALTMLLRPIAAHAQRAALDTWIALRFRDAQLLADSAMPTRSTREYAQWPRIETTRDGEFVDTLLAIQFDPRPAASLFRVGARVRLGASSGAIAALSADVRARRAFRAPAKPIMAGTDTTWRYGWGYVLTTAHVRAKGGAAVYQGWLLIALPDSAQQRERGKPPARSLPTPR